MKKQLTKKKLNKTFGGNLPIHAYAELYKHVKSTNGLDAAEYFLCQIGLSEYEKSRVRQLANN